MHPSFFRCTNFICPSGDENIAGRKIKKIGNGYRSAYETITQKDFKEEIERKNCFSFFSFYVLKETYEDLIMTNDWPVSLEITSKVILSALIPLAVHILRLFTV